MSDWYLTSHVFQQFSVKFRHHSEWKNLKSQAHSCRLTEKFLLSDKNIWLECLVKMMKMTIMFIKTHVISQGNGTRIVCIKL